MKALIFFASLFTAGITTSFAQCGKNLLLTASQTTYLDTSGTVQRIVDEKSIIQMNQSKVVINVNDENKMTFVIKSNTCNWEVPFKQGKIALTGTMTKESGDTVNVSIDIEGKDGKITLIFKMEGRPVVIKVVMDKFEEEM